MTIRAMIPSDRLVDGCKEWVETVWDAGRLDVACGPEEGEGICLYANPMIILLLGGRGGVGAVIVLGVLYICRVIGPEQALNVLEINEDATRRLIVVDEDLSTSNLDTLRVVYGDLILIVVQEWELAESDPATGASDGAIIEPTWVLPLQSRVVDGIPSDNLLAPWIAS